MHVACCVSVRRRYACASYPARLSRNVVGSESAPCVPPLSHMRTTSSVEHLPHYQQSASRASILCAGVQLPVQNGGCNLSMALAQTSRLARVPLVRDFLSDMLTHSAWTWPIVSLRLKCCAVPVEARPGSDLGTMVQCHYCQWQGVASAALISYFSFVTAGASRTDPFAAESTMRCPVSTDLNVAQAQVPMSKFEPTEFLDDRYKKMDERLEVRMPAVHACAWAQPQHCSHGLRRSSCACSRASFEFQARFLQPLLRVQVVRKRLNHPLTLAEKVSRPVPRSPALSCRFLEPAAIV